MLDHSITDDRAIFAMIAHDVFDSFAVAINYRRFGQLTL